MQTESIPLSRCDAAIEAMSPEDIERFGSKVGPPTATGCTEWQRCRNRRTGYGRFRVNRETVPTHRVAYFIAHRESIAGWFVCHACDNPPCVNPEHLFLGSPADNAADCVAKGRTVRVNPTLTPALVHEARVLQAAGVSYPALARRYGVSYSTVRNAVRGISWESVPFPHEVPAPRQLVKITQEDAERIRELAETMSQKEICELYPLHNATISKIILRKIWK